MTIPFCVSQTVAAGPRSATGCDAIAAGTTISPGSSTTRRRSVARFVVEDQRQVVERDDGMEVIGENLEELGHRLVAGKRLRDAQQGVVA